MLKKTKSLSRTLSLIYGVFIVSVVLFSVLFANYTTSKEVSMTTFNNVTNTVDDKFTVLSRNFDQLFEQLVFLNNNPNLLDVINNDSGSLRSAVNMNDTIKGIYYRFQDVLSSIYINVNEGEFFFNDGNIEKALTEIQYDDFFEYVESGDSDYFWMTAKESPFTTAYEQTISLGKVIGNPTAEVSGVIVFNLKASFIEQVLNESYVTDHGHLVLLKGQESAFEVEDAFPPAVYKKITSGQERIIENQVVYHTVTREFNKGGWKLAAIFPDRDLSSGQNSYFKLAITLMLFLIVMGTVFVFLLERLISLPIQRLAKGIENVRINEFDQPLMVERSPFSELMVLYDSFNVMIQRNSRLLNENRRNEEELNRLEIELLQSQINPHFLYNTLYSIQSLSEMAMNKEAALMSKALADFYRQGVRTEGIIVTLSEELAHVESYLQIMGFRYQDRFTYDVRVEDVKALEEKIPQYSLQPIIENSIYHGLKESQEKGHLQVVIRSLRDSVLIIITDSGKGIREKDILQINQEINQPAGKDHQLIGIGLRSVNLRIKRYFGRGYGLWIEEAAQGTCVKIVIPKENHHEATTDC